jgi:ankyrin repeat protein
MAESVTPLHVAAKFGHYEICQFIFNNILDHNHQRNDGCTPFDNAVLFGNLRVAKLIFENNADDPLNLGQTIRMNLFFWILDMAILSYRLYTNSFVQPIDSVFSILTY